MPNPSFQVRFQIYVEQANDLADGCLSESFCSLVTVYGSDWSIDHDSIIIIIIIFIKSCKNATYRPLNSTFLSLDAFPQCC